MQVGLALGRQLHLLDQPLRRDQRFVQAPLALDHAALAVLHGGQLLLEQLALLEQCRLVVVRHVLQEGVDLLVIGAAEHPDRELLLADVVGLMRIETSARYLRLTAMSRSESTRNHWRTLSHQDRR